MLIYYRDKLPLSKRLELAAPFRKSNHSRAATPIRLDLAAQLLVPLPPVHLYSNTQMECQFQVVEYPLIITTLSRLPQTLIPSHRLL